MILHYHSQCNWQLDNQWWFQFMLWLTVLSHYQIVKHPKEIKYKSILCVWEVIAKLFFYWPIVYTLSYKLNKHTFFFIGLSNFKCYWFITFLMLFEVMLEFIIYCYLFYFIINILIFFIFPFNIILFYLNTICINYYTIDCYSLLIFNKHLI